MLALGNPSFRNCSAILGGEKVRTVDERAASLNSTIAEAMRSVGVNIRVALPGIIRGWDKPTQTVKVQVAIREKISSGGEAKEMEIPLLVDVPVIMPAVGGYCFVATPKDGDECLVVFADMCIDAWWQSGGVQSQADKRRHDLSDGFAIMGCWSQPNKPSIPDEGCRLQNWEGTAGVSIKGSTVNIFGSVLINGSPYSSHMHSGVETGSGQTGGVVTASDS